MAHFAKLGTGNIVDKVVVVHDDIVTTEQAGVDFLNNLYGSRDLWKQTFEDGSERKNFAGAGYTYDETRDAFIPQKPFNSWVLNDTTCQWEAPTEYPDDGKKYLWNETNRTWDEVTND